MSTDNLFLARMARKNTQSKAYHRAPKQEKSLAKRLGAYQVSRSGAGTKKGDLFIDGFIRIEAKTTSAASFRVTLEMIEKITNAAVASNELPVIIVEFLNASGKPVSEVALLPVAQLEILLHAAKNKS